MINYHQIYKIANLKELYFLYKNYIREPGHFSEKNVYIEAVQKIVVIQYEYFFELIII